MIVVEETKLSGVKLVKPDAFEDHRGVYVETYNKKRYADLGIDMDFVQDDASYSGKGVLRGIHGDHETWKLISCLWGKFYLVVVNYDKTSAEFGRWQSFVLSRHNRYQILVPPNFGNGHLVLSEQAVFHYKQSTYYNPHGQFSLIWNDPSLNIWWPVKHPVVSRRDEMGKFLE